LHYVFKKLSTKEGEKFNSGQSYIFLIIYVTVLLLV